ncbi:MAG: DUF4381 domain-containing protein [Pseudomonadota bacterium]
MNPIDQLRDIHLPASPGWWPPAPGWWVIALLGTVSAVWIFRVILNRRKGRLKRRLAISALHNIHPDESGLYTIGDVSKMWRIVKTLIRDEFGNQFVTSPTESEFRQFMQRTFDSNNFPDTAVWNALATAHYKPNLEIDAGFLKEFLIDWCRTHRSDVVADRLRPQVISQ